VGATNSSRLQTLALALSTLVETPIQAQSNDGLLSLTYYQYQDSQEGGKDRMSVMAPVVTYQIPLDESITLSGMNVWDGMSGASPLYHDTLSGASGSGIHDNRYAGNLTLSKSFERETLFIGGEFSDEDDYTARGALIGANFSNESQDATFSYVLAGSSDDIGSSNNPALAESRRTISNTATLIQVLDSLTVMQGSLQVQNSDGFLTDPYKLQDNRPRSRDFIATTLALNHYVPQSFWGAFNNRGGALGVNYRYFADSWDLNSHTVQGTFSQEVSDSVTVRPLVRYYSQSEAFFYDPLYPPFGQGFYSADQRMGAFGALSGGLRVEYKTSKASQLHLSYEAFQQDASWHAFGKGSSGIPNTYGEFWGMGISAFW
jgi:hypothetical protein